MHKGRLEAFSDGVIAIIITIMVLEIKVPHEATLAALVQLGPIFLSYVISFLYIGIYWNNHHHLLQSISKINGQVLWANLLLLFCLSLIPFASGWMGENHFSDITVTMYGIVLFVCAMAYYYLTISLLKIHANTTTVHKAVGNKIKERASLATYIIGTVVSLWYPLLAFISYSLVAILWILPDRRIERHLNLES